MIDIYLFKYSGEKESSKEFLKYALNESFSYNGEVEFLYGEKGKPYLKLNNDIYFNISHSGECLVIALSDSEIGIDIERVRDVNFDIAKRFFCKEEYEYISDDKEKFFNVWTMKESCVKYTGRGIADNFLNFSVVNTSTLRYSLKGCKFKQYFLENDYVISVCAGEDNFPEQIKIVEGII